MTTINNYQQKKKNGHGYIVRELQNQLSYPERTLSILQHLSQVRREPDAHAVRKTL